MSESQSHIDMQLEILLTLEKMRVSNLRSTHWRHFEDYDAGDSISLTLMPLSPNEIGKKEPQRIEGTLENPTHAIIDIKYVEGDLDELLKRKIGLAVWTIVKYPVRDDQARTFSRFVAGKDGFAFYVPEDIAPDEDGWPTVQEDKIKVLPLQYGRLAVNGAPIFDFLDDL